jgi:hypothetical protein
LGIGGLTHALEILDVSGNILICDRWNDLGADKITNGTFTGSATGWTLASGWTYSSNTVKKDGNGTGTLSQTSAGMVTPLVAGQFYQLTFTISAWSVGTVAASVGGASNGIVYNSNGTYSETFLAVNTNDLTFTPSNTARFTIDTISLKQVTGGDLRVVGTAQFDSDMIIATGKNIKVNNANTPRSIMLGAAGGYPTTTAGCASPTRIEFGTNDIDLWVLDFDTSTEEHAFWMFPTPDNWDAGTLTAKFYWTCAGGSAAQTVRWGIKGGSFSNDDAIDAAYGSEVTVDDTFIANGDLHISAESAAITLAGSPAAGDLVVMCVSRKVASDDLAGDARLIGVRLIYTTNVYGY